MMPGALELAENAIHLLRHGDTAHADTSHAGDRDDDEHGCSGTYHACTCHSSSLFVDNAVSPRVMQPRMVASRQNFGLGVVVGSELVRRLERPPRA